MGTNTTLAETFRRLGNERLALIEELTDDQARDALRWLSGWMVNDPRFEEALAYGRNAEHRRCRDKGYCNFIPSCNGTGREA